jgi:hypothetical protein
MTCPSDPRARSPPHRGDSLLHCRDKEFNRCMTARVKLRLQCLRAICSADHSVGMQDALPVAVSTLAGAEFRRTVEGERRKAAAEFFLHLRVVIILANVPDPLQAFQPATFHGIRLRQ